jgi:iron complex transport system permease protein
MHRHDTEQLAHRRERKMALVGIALLIPVALAVGLLAGSSGFGLPGGSDIQREVILAMRWDRVLCGLLVGAALAVSGVVLQSVLRNPLAEPYVLGVSSGAALGAAFAILASAATVTWFAVPLLSFVGGLITLGIVYLLACAGGAMSVYGLILGGVIVSAMCSSLLMFMVTTANREGLHNVIWWMLGNLQPMSGPLLYSSGLIVLLCTLLLWLMSRELNALGLGSDVSHFVGVRARVVVPVLLMVATLLTASAVSMAGLIGFVGLIVPHVVRGLVGGEHRRLIPSAAIVGGAFLVICDALARTLLAPREIPVGVVTALCGGPFFLAILIRKRKKGWLA